MVLPKPFGYVSCFVYSAQKPVETASSKMMMSWLKSSTPTKRKEPADSTKTDTGEKSTAQKRPKTAGPLQQWLLGSEMNKK